MLTAAISGLAYFFGGATLALKTLYSYLPLWALAEFAHGIHLREMTKCRVCGFDPILYKRDWKAARIKVELKLNALSANLKANKQGTSPGPVATPTSSSKTNTNSDVVLNPQKLTNRGVGVRQ